VSGRQLEMKHLQQHPKVDISNPDKVLFPRDGITKADLAAYYEEIAGTMLPHVRDRAVAMHRFPDGIRYEGFIQKDVPEYFPEWIKTVTVKKARGSVTHVVIDKPATVVYLADQACITPHVWLSRIDRPDHPDRLIFDLDPSGRAFEGVVAAARALREVLEAIDLVPYLMTTGSRGLHVVVPLDRGADFDTVRALARRVATSVADETPDRFTIEQRKEKRRGRVYLDTMRNAYAQTAVAPYAVRALPGAPVAAPLEWAELSRVADAQPYTIKTIARRLARKGDPWKDIARRARAVHEAERQLDALESASAKAPARPRRSSKSEGGAELVPARR
jgi:bifunctional non-homologous end joining protein LigD